MINHNEYSLTRGWLPTLVVSYLAIFTTPTALFAEQRLPLNTRKFYQPVEKDNIIYYRMSKYYPDILARDITKVTKDCEVKKTGMNRGRVCFMEDTTYFMKYASMRVQTDIPRVLQEINNLHFVRTYLNITAPTAELIWDRGRIYISSASIDNFQTAQNLIEGNYSKPEFRAALLKHIPVADLPKLIVLQTLFKDVNKVDNWGYNKNGLVAVDVDQTPPTVADFPQHAANSLLLATKEHFNRHAGIDLSRVMIEDMLTIYEALTQSVIVHPYPSFSLSNADYQFVFHLYMAACEEAIREIKEYEKSNFITVRPAATSDNNQILAKWLLKPNLPSETPIAAPPVLLPAAPVTTNNAIIAPSPVRSSTASIVQQQSEDKSLAPSAKISLSTPRSIQPKTTKSVDYLWVSTAALSLTGSLLLLMIMCRQNRHLFSCRHSFFEKQTPSAKKPSPAFSGDRFEGGATYKYC